MKTTSFISVALSLAGSSLAAPTAQSKPAKDRFALVSFRPGHPEVSQFPIHANEGGFWLNHDTNSSCPLPEPKKCPKGQDTIFFASEPTVNGYSNLYLDVAVPGGQQVYIDPANGELRFTAPGEAPPADIKLDTFVIGSSYIATAYGPLYACHVKGQPKNVHRLFAPLNKSVEKRCTAFDSAKFDNIRKKHAAYQYN